MDGTKISVLEETYQVGLGSLLECKNSSALEAKIRLEVLSDLSDKALEGQLANQEFRGLLVLADLTEGDGTGPIAVGTLDTASGRGGLTRLLGSQLNKGKSIRSK